MKELDFLEMHAFDAGDIGADQAIASAIDKRGEGVFGDAGKEIFAAKEMQPKGAEKQRSLARGAAIQPKLPANRIINEHIMFLRTIKQRGRLVVLHSRDAAARQTMAHEEPP